MKRLLIAGALLCASFLPVRASQLEDYGLRRVPAEEFERAQAREGCISIDAATSMLSEAGAAYTVLDGDRKSRAVAFYNSVPPETGEAWDIALVALLPNGAGVLAVGMGTEICGRVVIPPHEVQGVLRAIYGQGA